MVRSIIFCLENFSCILKKNENEPKENMLITGFSSSRSSNEILEVIKQLLLYIILTELFMRLFNGEWSKTTKTERKQKRTERLNKVQIFAEWYSTKICFFVLEKKRKKWNCSSSKWTQTQRNFHSISFLWNSMNLFIMNSIDRTFDTLIHLKMRIFRRQETTQMEFEFEHVARIEHIAPHDNSSKKKSQVLRT